MFDSEVILESRIKQGPPFAGRGIKDELIQELKGVCGCCGLYPAAFHAEDGMA